MRLRLFFSIMAFCGVVSAHDEKTVNNFEDSHEILLVQAGRSPTVGQNTVARFRCISKLEGLAGKEISVRFPSHSLTAHEASIIALIKTAWCGRSSGAEKPFVDVVYSIPRKQIEDGYLIEGPFDEWVLRRIQPAQQDAAGQPATPP